MKGALLQKITQIKDYENIIANQTQTIKQLEEDSNHFRNRLNLQEAELLKLRCELEDTKAQNETLMMKYSDAERLLQESDKHAASYQNAERTLLEYKNTTSLLRRRINTFQNDLTNSNATITEMGDLLAKREKEICFLKSIVEKSDTQNESHVSEINSLKEKLTDMESYEVQLPELQCLVKDYECLIVTLRKESEALRQESRALIDRVKSEAQRRILHQESEIKQLHDSFSAVSSENKKAMLENENLKSSLEQVKQVANKVPSLEDALDGTQKELRSLREKDQSIIKNLQSNLATVSSENKALQIVVENQGHTIENRKKTSEEMQLQLENTISELSAYEKIIAEKNEDVLALENKLCVTELELQRLQPHIKELLQKNKKQNETIQRQEQKLESTTDNYKRLTLEQEDMKQTLRELKVAYQEAQELSKSVPFLESKLAETEANLACFEKIHNCEAERNQSLIEVLQNELYDVTNQKRMIDTKLKDCKGLKLERQLDEANHENKTLRKKLNHAKMELSKQRSTNESMREKAKDAITRKMELERIMEYKKPRSRSPSKSRSPAALSVVSGAKSRASRASLISRLTMDSGLPMPSITIRAPPN